MADWRLFDLHPKKLKNVRGKTQTKEKLFWILEWSANVWFNHFERLHSLTHTENVYSGIYCKWLITESIYLSIYRKINKIDEKINTVADTKRGKSWFCVCVCQPHCDTQHGLRRMWKHPLFSINSLQTHRSDLDSVLFPGYKKVCKVKKSYFGQEVKVTELSCFDGRDGFHTEQRHPHSHTPDMCAAHRLWLLSNSQSASFEVRS